MIQRLVTTPSLDWLPEDSQEGYKAMRSRLRQAAFDLRLALNCLETTPWPRSGQLKGQLEYAEVWTREREQREFPEDLSPEERQAMEDKNKATIAAAHARLDALRKALAQAERDEEASARETQNKRNFDIAVRRMEDAMGAYSELINIAWEQNETRNWWPQIQDGLEEDERDE